MGTTSVPLRGSSDALEGVPPNLPSAGVPIVGWREWCYTVSING
ncbi:hypothetical protein THTE_0826 [Thermogutta terrifontis]|uniref:Uncharacterized protein n=1 Tax=Thermogutta terrifontis TaxID=1331910 RepID=A0A286RBU8_9BACT|nr:hypothetical protein THTE_0826 [Thermogutta terrifontis]